MRNSKATQVETSTPADGKSYFPVPEKFMTSVGMFEFLKTAFTWAFILSVIAYGADDDEKFSEDWLLVNFSISLCVSLLVSAFGWALWVRVLNWLAGKMSVANFNRTVIPRKVGVLVLVVVVALGIHSVLRLLARLGF